MMVEHMDGKCTGGHFLESLLAEGTISLLALTGPAQAQKAQKAEEADVSAQMEAEHTAWRAQMQRLQHLHAEAELRSRPAVTTEPNRVRPPTPTTCPSASRRSTRASVTTAQSSPVAICSSAAWRNAS